MIALDDEILMRRVDGELDAAEAARVDSAAAADPAVNARLEALRGARTAARGAFPIAADARDLDLGRLIASAPVRASPLAVIGRTVRDAFAPRRILVWGPLATAAFVCGLALAPVLERRPDSLAVGRNGQIRDPGLVRVLDRRLAGEGEDRQGRAVGLTFRDVEGGWCRTFTARDAGVAGLACRDAADWRLQALAPLIATEGEVRTASSETPPAVLGAVDALIAGETLDAAAETSARDAGWPRGD